MSNDRRDMASSFLSLSLSLSLSLALSFSFSLLHRPSSAKPRLTRNPSNSSLFCPVLQGSRCTRRHVGDLLGHVGEAVDE